MHQQSLITTLALALLTATPPLSAAERSVTTSKTWLSGATTIYARMDATGFSSSAQQGFCYSTNPMPTVDDGTSTAFLTNNGKIFKISDLQPATVYYIRAYVKNGSTVHYGNPVKAITRPGGGVSYGVFGFPDDMNTRVQAAAKEAIGLWNEYTGIQGLYMNINYGSGTPTADCSYGGYMRIGQNASYQKTGTLLHEMLHAIGVGTLPMWYNGGWLRGGSTSGAWRGVRVNRVIKFWDNDQTATLKGDGTHMWPYGVNGAHEDAGTQVLYVGNSFLAEALGEDGLAPTSGQFATPAYAFEQEDTMKYYIRNESGDFDMGYLRESGTSGQVQWASMTKDEALKNDSAAWYVTFDPSTCYYMLRNAATGKFLSCGSTGANGMKASSVETPSAKEKFHLLPSCVDAVNSDESPMTGFWVLNVDANTATALTATANNGTSANSLNFTEGATSQRWLFLNADEVGKVDSLTVGAAKEVLDALLANIEALRAVPHTEDTEGADATLDEALASIKEREAQAATAKELENLTDEASELVRPFLTGVSSISMDNPFDLTFMLQNPGMDAADGWSVAPTINYSCAEFYEKRFDMTQQLNKMPAGTYEVKVQGFQRPGTSADVYKDWQDGTDNVTVYLYSGSTKEKLKNIMADAQSKKLGGTESNVATGVYIPNNMLAASLYFAQGLYENSMTRKLARQATLKFGLSCTSSSSSYWTIFDNFRLYYYGTPNEDVNGIRNVEAATNAGQGARQGIYSFNGTLVSRDTSRASSLPKGLYIVDGKKVIIK